MKRREFISLVGGAAALPLVARAQQPAKMKRIAMVHTYEAARDMIASYHPFYGAFFNELSRAGYIEGKNLDVERYSADGRPERYDELVRNVLDTRPDAIYALDGALTVLFKASTTTIPILAIANDPVAEGLVPNIARPGGNITGVSIDLGSEIWGKRIGVLKEALPKISNVGVIALSAKVWETVSGMAARQAAKSASISMTVVALDEEANVAAYQRVFAAIEKKRLDAIIVSETPVHVIYRNISIIVELAAKHRLPTLYLYREFVELGGLMSYSVDLAEVGRLNGYQLGEILNGTSPGDIPFIQVTRYQLTLNLKTAKSLGIEFPATLLGTADFIIE